jgi:hypothetical protein
VQYNSAVHLHSQHLDIQYHQYLDLQSLTLLPNRNSRWSIRAASPQSTINRDNIHESVIRTNAQRPSNNRHVTITCHVHIFTRQDNPHSTYSGPHDDHNNSKHVYNIHHPRRRRRTHTAHAGSTDACHQYHECPRGGIPPGNANSCHPDSSRGTHRSCTVRAVLIIQ